MIGYCKVDDSVRFSIQSAYKIINSKKTLYFRNERWGYICLLLSFHSGNYSKHYYKFKKKESVQLTILKIVFIFFAAFFLILSNLGKWKMSKECSKGSLHQQEKVFILIISIYIVVAKS